LKNSTGVWVEVLEEVLAFLLLMGSIVLLWRDNLLLFAVVLVEALVVLALWHERYDVAFFAVVAGLGTLAEVVFVNFGVWHYANPTVLGIPLWFPLSFGTAALIGARLVRTLTRGWQKPGSS
jgi:uncharacterized membrane protein YoaT (DUF817 family)